MSHSCKIKSASRVSNRDRTLSGGSTPSNIGGSLTRVNSVTSVLKRLFSKEDRPDGTGTSSGSKTPGRLPNSSSAVSLQARGTAPQSGSMRIGVIEEVDEQMTLTSIRPESRPHVESIFAQGPPPPSAPVDVPGADHHSRNGEIFSSSAPAAAIGSGGNSNIGGGSAGEKRFGPDVRQRTTHSARSSIAYEPSASFAGTEADPPEDAVSTASSSISTGSADDEFTKLKVEREKQRRDKALQRLVRSISGHTQVAPSKSSLDAETLILTELADASRLSMKQGESDDKDNETDNV